MEKRSWIGHYFLMEIEYAANTLNYQFTIKECLIYTKAQKIFANFFKTLANLKIRSEALPSDMSHEEKVQWCEELNSLMQFEEEYLALSPEVLTPNPQLRNFLKTLQNMILG